MTVTLHDLMVRAQQRADQTHIPSGIWVHVGLYGHRSGDIPARHSYKVQALTAPDPAEDWALVATVDPEAAS